MSRVRTIAVMQPYFFPYAGYFRLLTHSDEFVIFDCVQFPRRGRVHRAEVPGPSGIPEWLTLPIAACARETRIMDLTFGASARSLFDQRLSRLPWVGAARGFAADQVRSYLQSPLAGSLVDFLEEGLRLVTRSLGIEVRISRSSALMLDPSLRGQERVLAVVKRLGGTRYLNAPGGRELYDEGSFAREGLELSFLPPYSGRHPHMLHSLMTENLDQIREEIVPSHPTFD